MLTAKQMKFVEAYKELGNGPQSAISAGYSAKSAAIEANRLLKHPAILLELDNWRKTKQTVISKADFIDMAISDYRELDVTEPNKPRFLDLAGKALGHIGVVQDNRTQTINNNLQLNLNGAESQSQLWEMTRKLLADS